MQCGGGAPAYHAKDPGCFSTKNQSKRTKKMKLDKPGQLKAQLPLGLSSRRASDKNFQKLKFSVMPVYPRTLYTERSI